MEPLTITIDAAQKAIGVKRSTIYSLIADGRIEAVKIGRRRLIKVASIRALVDQAA